MSDQNASLKVLRRVKNVALVRHSSGRLVELGTYNHGKVISLRPVRDVDTYLAKMRAAEERGRTKNAG